MEEEKKLVREVDGVLVDDAYDGPVMDIVEVAKWIHSKLPEGSTITEDQVVGILELEMDWMVENGYAVSEPD